MAAYEHLRSLLKESAASVWLGGDIKGSIAHSPSNTTAEDRRDFLRAEPRRSDLAGLLYLARLWELESSVPPRLKGVVTSSSGTTLERLVCAVSGCFPHVVTNRRYEFLPSLGEPTKRPTIVHTLDDELWSRDGLDGWPTIGVDARHLAEIVRDTSLYIFGWDDALANQVESAVATARKVIWCTGLKQRAVPESLNQISRTEVEVLNGVDLLIWSAAACEAATLRGLREGNMLSWVGFPSLATACGDWLNEYRLLDLQDYDRSFLSILHTLAGMDMLEKDIANIAASVRRYDEIRAGRLANRGWYEWAEYEEMRLGQQEARGIAGELLPEYAPDQFLEGTRPPLELARYLSSSRRHAGEATIAIVEDRIRKATANILTRCRRHFKGSNLLVIEAAYEPRIPARWEKVYAALKSKPAKPEVRLLRCILNGDGSRLRLHRETECTRSPDGSGREFEMTVRVTNLDVFEDPAFGARWVHRHTPKCPMRSPEDVTGFLANDPLSSSTQTAFFWFNGTLHRVERLRPHLTDSLGQTTQHKVAWQTKLREIARKAEVPLRILVSHSDSAEDDRYVADCKKHLRVLESEGKISIAETRPLAGELRESSFLQDVNDADVMLAMMSVDYVNRWPEHKHVRKARERADRRELTLILVTLRPFLLSPEHPFYGLKPWPFGERGVATLDDKDAFWTGIAREILNFCSGNVGASGEKPELRT